MKNFIKIIAISTVLSVSVTSCSWFKKDKPANGGSDVLLNGANGGVGTEGVDGNGMGNINQAAQEELIATAGDRIFFAVDSSSLSSEAQETLRKQANFLSQNANVNITVEGHCDERGTREYNIALGERRANAAKDFLISQGVNAARINTISYGKEFPEFLGSNEEAWGKNRRSVTVVN